MAASPLLLILICVMTHRYSVWAASSKPLPSESSCTSAYNALGQQTVLSRLSPCQGGITADCCAAGQALAGTSGDLAFCLCSPKLLAQIITTVESNPLARSAGITGGSIKAGWVIGYTEISCRVLYFMVTLQIRHCP